MASETDTSQVAAKLDTLIRLMALSIAPASMSLKDRAVMLTRAGLTPMEIASLCDTTRNTVSVALSTAKRGSKKRGA